MKEQLAQIKERALEGLAACTTMRELEDLRVQVLGKKGELTGILKQMGKLSPEERPVIGQLANEVRQDLEQKLDEYKAALREKQLNEQLEAERLDVTLSLIHIFRHHSGLPDSGYFVARILNGGFELLVADALTGDRSDFCFKVNLG